MDVTLFRRFIPTGLALSAAVLLASGCRDGRGPTAPLSPTTATRLSGIVSRGRNQVRPVSGAFVEILDGPNAGISARTNIQGSYSLAALLRGTVQVRASKQGLTSQTIGTSLAGAISTLDFRLAKEGPEATLEATVLGELGERLYLATVTILSGPDAGDSITTHKPGDDEGPYAILFDDLSPGTIQIVADRNKYKSQIQTVDLAGGQTTSVTFHLKSAME